MADMTDAPLNPPEPRYKAILLFGPPGSGKGTQGRILSAIPGFFHSATGDIFRSLDLTSESGRLIWQYTSRGELVPDEVTLRVWKQYIRGMEMINQFHPESDLLILDGVPRSVEQARMLEDTIDVVKIIHLRADYEKLVVRLRRRALKENRVDDASEEVIRKRMRIYESDTRPLLDYYGDDRIVEIEATMTQIRVLRTIIDVLVPLKERMDRERGTPAAETRGSKDRPAAVAAAVSGG